MKVSKWSIALAVLMTSVVVTCLIVKPLDGMSLGWVLCLACGTISTIVNWIDVIKGIFKDKQVLPNLFLIASMANLICFCMDVLLALVESRLSSVYPTAVWLLMGIACWFVRGQTLVGANDSASLLKALLQFVGSAAFVAVIVKIGVSVYE